MSKFKKLSQEDKNFLLITYRDAAVNYETRREILKKKFGVSDRTIRKWVRKIEGNKPKGNAQFEAAQSKKFNKTKKRFLISWGQNATPPHYGFLENLKAYAKFLDADIHIIAGRYRNPSSVFVDEKHDWWHPEILPYLDSARHDLHKYVTVLSDIKIQPTATNPLSGLKGISGEGSTILGHPRLHIETLPVLPGSHQKVMMTTGASTVRNYTDSKAGKKGDFHHSLGAVIVEVKDDDTVFFRQFNATPAGDFSDLYYEVKDGEVKRLESCAGLVWGDIHCRNLCKKTDSASRQLMSKIKPNEVVFHDIFDGDSINPHAAKNPILNYHKVKSGRNSLTDEIDEMMIWLEGFKDENVVIVNSNHDDFCDRFILNNDWKLDPTNALEYVKYAALLMEGKAENGIIAYLINERFGFNCLGLNESHKIKDFEVSQHGHIGSNGARGGIQNFRNLNVKMIVAHSHSPGRKEGVLQVGTSTVLRMDYNKGASSWANAHSLIHNDGKAQLIYIFNGEFTTL